jgi:hypothetical protein
LAQLISRLWIAIRQAEGFAFVKSVVRHGTKALAMDNQDDIPRNYLSRIGRKGGSVKSPAKSEAAKLRNAKRKTEGKPECKEHKGVSNV